jgi:hypothetical protein
VAPEASPARREGKMDDKLRLVVLLDLLDTAQAARAAGGDETDLLTGGRVTADRRRVTDMLVVTTTVGVLHRVHGHTTDLGPLVALDAVLVVGTASLEDRLVGTATAGDDTDHGAAPEHNNTKDKRQRGGSARRVL